MSALPHLLQVAVSKWHRDAALPLAERLDKAIQYAWGLTVAPWNLRQVDVRGSGARTLGTPRIENHGGIFLGNNVFLRSATIPVELYTARGAEIRMGDGCILNSGASLAAVRRIELGKRVFVGGLAYIMDTSFHDVTNRDVHPEGQPVILEDDVWIGVKASVMPGVRIGRGAVVAAHAVVTHDVPPYSLAAGIPARVVRSWSPAAAPGAP